MSLITFSVNTLNANKGWRYLKDQFKTKKYKLVDKNWKKIPEEDKFCSFFTNSLLPRKISKKFDKFYILRNNKKDYINFGFSRELSEHNIMVIEVIFTGFLIFYFALYNIYDFLDSYQLDNKREDLIKQIFNINIFYQIYNLFFFDYFLSNDLIQDITISFKFDKEYYYTFINYYNLNLWPFLSISDIILNFEKYKYEEDFILYGEEKANKNKLLIDIFNYDFLNYQYDLYFIYCIYEFFNIFTFTNFVFHDLNFEFFNKILVYQDNFLDNAGLYDASFFRYKSVLKLKKKEWCINEYFLNHLYTSFCLDYLKKKKKKRIEAIINRQKFLYIDYSMLKKNNLKNFNLKNFILDYKFYYIKMPAVIFLLYSWYAIYFKRVRYNNYIIAHKFFQEYPSRMNYFIWLNNTRSSNLWKYAPLKFQKLFTVYHYKSYVEINLFNEFFYFYFGLKTRLKKFINNNNIWLKQSYFNLTNNILVKQLIKDQNLVKNKFDISLVFNEYLTNNAYNYEMLEAYTLFMNTPIVKFETKFCLGRLGYWEYDEMLETVFTFINDQRRLQYYMKKRLVATLYFSIYNNYYNNYYNLYFIKDFYNYKNLNDMIKYKKIFTFYNKLIYIVFFFLDPFFFKYFWKRCFPKKWNKLWKIYEFVWKNIFLVKFFYGVEKFGQLEFSIKKYSFFMFFLNWRIDTGSSMLKNFWYSDIISYNNIIINLIYKNRFIELVKQINALWKKYKINNWYKFVYFIYLVNLKNFYFDLLYENIEYGLIFFFFNIQKNLNNLFFCDFEQSKNIIFYNYIYRFYVLVILFQNRYYDNWFYDWKKRILMTYVDNFHKHDGKHYYSKLGDIF